MEGNEVPWFDLCMSEIRLARTSSENDVWYLPRYIYISICHLHLCMVSKYMNNNICCFLSAVNNELKKH